MTDNEVDKINTLMAGLAAQLRAERRERIATAALQGLLTFAGNGKPNENSYLFATHAIAYADALIAELDKETQQ